MLSSSPPLSRAPQSNPLHAAAAAGDAIAFRELWDGPGARVLFPPGTPGAGGPLVTAGGLVFIGYTLDDTLRAFDLKTGNVLWKADLPAAGTAVPVTYEAGGKQYVVIAAGGHTMYGSTTGDSVVAYRLKR